MDQPYIGYDSPVVFNGWLYNPPKPEPDQTCPACCDCCECGIGVSEVGVRYVNGEVRLSIPVLTAGRLGRPWGHTITYTNRLPASWDFGNGFNWFVEQWPYLLKCVDEEFQTFNYIVFVQSSWTAVWFDFDEMSGDYSPRHGAHYGLTHDTANNVYKLATCGGEIWEFNDWDQTSAPGGSFKRLTTKGGTTIEVVSYTAQCRIAEMRRTYTSGGTTVVESLLYTYFTSCEQRGRLQTVTLRRQVNGGSWTEVARAEFEYYGEADGVECAGDLKRIKVQVLSGTSWQDEAVYSFRYYQMGESNGFARGLKYVVAPESYNRLVASIGNPDNATDTQVAGFADRFIEYDANKRVKTVEVAGGTRSHTFTYTASSHSNSYNSWKMKSVETRPGGSQRIVYTNYVGQTMVDEFKSGTQSWIDYFKFDGNARRIEHASPSAVTGYNDSQANLGVSLRSSDGLIHVTDYYASGDGEGHVQFEKVKQGSGGTAVKLKAFEYVARTAGLASVHPVSKETVYRNSDGTGAIDTTYSYSWYTGTVQMEERATSLPAIPTAQHGSGSADTRTERYDLYGNLTWLKNERGFLTRHTYDIPTGVRTETIEDVDTTQVSAEPSGWTTPSGGGLHLISEFDADARGRVIETREPWHTNDLGGTPTSVRSVQWSVYKDLDGEVWSAAGYATGTAPNYTYTLINPVSITRRDDAGRVTDEIQAVRASTTGKLSASDSLPQSTWVRWSTNSYSDQGDRVWSRVYHTIPASGAGSSGTNYDQIDFGIDAQGRRNKVKTPGGTITRTVFDVRGQAIKTYVGTNDTGATDSDPTGGGATGNNMVLVSENEFDGGSAGGDGNLTKVTQHVDSGTTRVTSMSYDFRGRRIDTDGEIDHFERLTYDNFDRVVKSERYNTSASGNLISRSETNVDDRGRTYQSIRYAVNPSTGSVGDALIDRTWFDAAGSPIKQLPGGTQQFTKTADDSLGRPVKTYVGFDTSESTCADATTVTGDTIFEQTETSYDATGNVIQVTQLSRLHDATGTGELSTPSGSQPRARVTYTALYPDGAGREIAQANYGDNGGASFTRSSTIPSRSDTVLVQTVEYHSEGESYKSIDPAGKEDRTFYDDAGRVVKTVENYDDGDPTTGAADKDRTVEFTYTADGQRKTITARQQNSANDQVTRYVHGTTLSDSDVARSDLLRAVIYPDSDDADSPLGNGSDGVYDRVQHRYNRQGQVKETKDQNGTVHAFEFDQLGRPNHDRVTALGSGVDGAVRRVSTTYEVRGLVEKITTYDNAAVGSGSVVNEVVREYNDLGLIVKEHQEHSGAKSGSTPFVGYNYDTTASSGEFTKGLRPTSLRYPNARLVHFTYGSSGSADDNLNRLQAIKDDSSGSPGATLASYSYLGLRAVVVQDLEEPDIKLDLFGGTSGAYAVFDRFGRVIDQRWYDYGSCADVDHFKYGYDRASSRIWRENTVSKALSTPVYLDEFYTYDGLHRLKTFDRGQLNGTYTGITGTPSKEEDWSLDPLGNWSNFVQKTSGTTDLDQSRVVNTVNQITDFTETVGPSWITPAYDRNGNMTTIPRPADPTASFTATYDAWNHLVKIESGSTTVATYAYDGRHFRTTTTAASTTRHFYYTASWQTLEERVGSSTSAERQFIWGPLYIDHLILRDRDTSSPPVGTLDERLYALQDGNWNVTALAGAGGAVQERCAYSAYGTPIVSDSSFVVQSSSSFGWETLFVGYRWDSLIEHFHVRHRVFHALGGTWLQRDPLMAPTDETNPYSYSRLRPSTLLDPMGLTSWEGPWIGGPWISVKFSVHFGPWKCRKVWLEHCQAECQGKRQAFKGCMWLADVRVQSRQFTGVTISEVGAYLAFVHCCCQCPKCSAAEGRKKWEACRDKFRERVKKSWGDFPHSDDGTNWSVHHVHPLEYCGDPCDRKNLVPWPPKEHPALRKLCLDCYSGVGGWDTPGPEYPYGK